MKSKIIIRKKSRKPGGRRSQTRLGALPTVMETSLSQSTFAIKPAITFWRINRTRIIGLFTLVLFGWIIYLLFDLDDFYVYKAEIQGNRILTAQEIYAASKVNSLSIFWINPEEVTANVEALPNIKTAQITLTLPANLTIEVEERQPEVLWQTGDTTWWVDIEGMFVPPREEIDIDKNRLRIIDGDGKTIQVNDRIDLAIIRSAQIIHEHKPEVRDILYTQQYGLAYNTPEGWLVYLGKSIDIPAKLLVADALRADLLARQIRPIFIDIRNPLRAVYAEQPTDTGL